MSDVRIALGEAYRTVSNAECRIDTAIRALDALKRDLTNSTVELMEAGERLKKTLDEVKAHE